MRNVVQDESTQKTRGGSLDTCLSLRCGKLCEKARATAHRLANCGLRNQEAGQGEAFNHLCRVPTMVAPLWLSFPSDAKIY